MCTMPNHGVLDMWISYCIFCACVRYSDRYQVELGLVSDVTNNLTSLTISWRDVPVLGGISINAWAFLIHVEDERTRASLASSGLVQTSLRQRL